MTKNNDTIKEYIEKRRKWSKEGIGCNFVAGESSTDTINQWIKAHQDFVNSHSSYLAQAQKDLEDAGARVVELENDLNNLINPYTMFEAYANLNQTFVDKNADYGNSFEESLNDFGLVAGVVRIGDKYNRLRTLTRVGSCGGRVNEPLIDTLFDMANYAVMTAVWLQGIEEEKESKDAETTKE